MANGGRRRGLYMALILLSILALLPLMGMIGLILTGPLLGDPGRGWALMGMSETGWMGCWALAWMILVAMLLIAFMGLLSRLIRDSTRDV